MLVYDARKAVDQTLFGGPEGPLAELGNCYVACLATIMGKALDDVPHFYQDAKLDVAVSGPAINRFAGKHGYGTVALNYQASAETGHLFPGAVVIISGESPRGPWPHAVVGEIVTSTGQWRLLHDPHPSRAGIVGEPVLVEYWFPLTITHEIEVP